MPDDQNQVVATTIPVSDSVLDDGAAPTVDPGMPPNLGSATDIGALGLDLSDQSVGSTPPTATSSAASSAAPPPAKDPLAVLEELLAKQKAAGAKAGVTPGAPSEVASTGPTPEEATAARKAEYERLAKEAALRDEALLAAQAQRFEQVKTSPQYQARVQQAEQLKQEEVAHQDATDGLEILQVTTTKIDVPSSSSLD